MAPLGCNEARVALIAASSSSAFLGSLSHIFLFTTSHNALNMTGAASPGQTCVLLLCHFLISALMVGLEGNKCWPMFSVLNERIKVTFCSVDFLKGLVCWLALGDTTVLVVWTGASPPRWCGCVYFRCQLSCLFPGLLCNHC